MGKLVYKKMSLFDAPKGSFLVHAGNAQGVWGSGIAAEFKKRFPEAFISYKSFCKSGYFTRIGEFDIHYDSGFKVTTLLTSDNYASKVDSPDEILVNTTLALNKFGNWMSISSDMIYSNKFNSGLFNVPWEKTEAILKVFVKRYDLNWTVCELEKIL